MADESVPDITEQEVNPEATVKATKAAPAVKPVFELPVAAPDPVDDVPAPAAPPRPKTRQELAWDEAHARLDKQRAAYAEDLRQRNAAKLAR